ncbi:cell division protein ZapE [Caenispirillum salinarum]|uniref:cell division protein ZapE n=1 Tax=Caenispirillum salinarum TaxID=859058 RepID=UPI0038516350
MSQSGPLALYRKKLANGELKPDGAQELAAEKLESLHHALNGYEPATGPTGWRARFGLAKRQEAPTPPQGLYLYGEVGRGKSMLMDLFFQTAPVQRKQRLHFHEFMRDVHADFHTRRTAKKGGDDILADIARGIADRTWLLCLDELEIHDIADAMIVGRLFQTMMAAGTVVVTTSNRPPQDLYKDGLQREKFLPFIDLMCRNLDVLELASVTDYRLGRVRGGNVFVTPLGPEADAEIDRLFDRLLDGKPAKPDTVVVHGREIPVPQAGNGTARFDFRDLCDKPLGTHDYLQIATLYDAVVLENIPRLGPENRNQARRFVTLIDALYDHKTLLVASAAAPPEDLYVEGEGKFEFQRTVSRLMEMQSEDYIGSQHLT